VQVLLQQARSQPASLRSRDIEVSEALDAIVLRALEKEPSARFGSANEMRIALRAVPEWDTWSQVDAELWWRQNGIEQPAQVFAPPRTLHPRLRPPLPAAGLQAPLPPRPAPLAFAPDYAYSDYSQSALSGEPMRPKEIDRQVGTLLPLKPVVLQVLLSLAD